MRVFGAKDQQARQTARAKVQFQTGFRPDPIRRAAVDMFGAVLHTAQGHLTHRTAAPVRQVVVDKPRFGDVQHIAQALDRGIVVILGRFQHQPHSVDPQDIGNLAPEILEEGFEVYRVKHAQDRAVDLVGPRKVFISRGDHVAVRVLKPVQACFQPVHGDAAQIDNIAPHRAFIRGDQGLHHVVVVKDDVGL